ncbi:hypothetical protein F2Q70_00030383 [Brassica cretica]|uniref:PPM-type phosphatase domain-containing protein n=1 Tax=Brassica cretica TaxID=69181 RepID=A0A8S9FRK9_BRACR|nr:hypothetical protein F2Q70_00030383 [Brassica cretica]
MGFWDFPFMQKAFRFERLVDGDVSRRKKKPFWLNPVSHGCYTIDRLSYIDRSPSADSVTVQREQQSEEELEVWFFAVSDAGSGREIVKYMQNHIFDKLHNEPGVLRKCKEIMRRAYVEEERSSGSAASVTVLDGEKLAMASIGDHRVVVCRDGEAYQLRAKSSTRKWSDFVFPVCYQGETDDESDSRDLELAMVTEKISSDTEFIIIGSSGIWQAFRFERLVDGDVSRRKKKPFWLNPVSHGCYTIDRLSYIDRSPSADSVTVQREQQSEEELEVWFFAVSDAGTGREIVKYMQNHIFDNEPGVLRKCKEIMRRAYVEEERSSGSAASVTVVDGEKLAMASIGDHRVVICRDGEAYQLRAKSSTRKWSDFVFPGSFP